MYVVNSNTNVCIIFNS